MTSGLMVAQNVLKNVGTRGRGGVHPLNGSEDLLLAEGGNQSRIGFSRDYVRARPNVGGETSPTPRGGGK